MKISVKGLAIIKEFEGLRLVAYKPVSTERYYTIGYGHYGPDVKANQTITKKEAEDLLKKDVESAEAAVSKLLPMIGQNAFDGLVSFTYNCGAGNLQKLVSGRNLHQISEKILLYNKAGGKELAGLTRRRKAEAALIKMDLNNAPAIKDLQIFLNDHGADPALVVDGIFGNKTRNAFLQVIGRVVD